MTIDAIELREQRILGYESARPDVQALVPTTARRILDLGCASGQLGAALKARQGAEVVGVELGADYAADAATRLDRVFTGDVLEVLRASADDLGTFDCVVCADVLEHLVDPWEALARAVALLAPGGTVVVSLPNVRSWQVLREVFVRGRWPRTTAGPFDGTHLRWFTLADARDLLTTSGLTVEHVEPRIWMNWERAIAPVLRVLRMPFLVHGQYVLVGVKR